MKYDWDRIEQEFVSGKMTMEALAKKYKIPNNTFYKSANVRKFSKKREEYAKRVQEKALARAQARDARTLGNLGSALDKAARTLNEYVNDEDTLFGRVSVSEKGVEEYKVKKLDTKALRDMTAAMREVSAAIKLLQPETENRDQQESGVILMPEMEEDESEENRE